MNIEYEKFAIIFLRTHLCDNLSGKGPPWAADTVKYQQRSGPERGSGEGDIEHSMTKCMIIARPQPNLEPVDHSQITEVASVIGVIRYFIRDCFCHDCEINGSSLLQTV